MLKSVTKGESYQFRDGSTPGEWIHLTHTKIKANKKKPKYSIHWLLLSIMAKMKVKECTVLGLDVKPRSDLGQSQR